MPVTYDEFLENETALDFEAARKIYDMILNTGDLSDRDFSNQLDEILARAVDYCNYRAKWNAMTVQQHLEIDEERSRAHDLFISAINKLSKYMYEKRYSIDWEDSLGADRKRIGDFACFLTYIQSLNAR